MGRCRKWKKDGESDKELMLVYSYGANLLNKWDVCGLGLSQLNLEEPGSSWTTHLTLGRAMKLICKEKLVTVKLHKAPPVDPVVCCHWWWSFWWPPSVPSFPAACFCSLVHLLHKLHYSCVPGSSVIPSNSVPSPLCGPPASQKRGGSVSAALVTWVGRLKVVMVLVGPGSICWQISCAWCVLRPSGSCFCYCTTKTAVGTFLWAKVCPENQRL